MNKRLKKILVTGAALLMFASVGASTNASAARNHNVGWRQVTRATNLKVNHGQFLHLRKNQRVYVIKLSRNKKSAQIKIGHNYYHINTNRLKNFKHNLKKNKKNGRKKNIRKVNQKRQCNIKRLAKKANNKRRHNHKKATKKNVKVLKSRFRRSNNKKLLAKSGFIDLRQYGPDIMSKYAPNSRKAVIPKDVNINDVLWFQGHLLQKNPQGYLYNANAKGWVKLPR